MEKILSVEMMQEADKYTIKNLISQKDLILRVGKEIEKNFIFDHNKILIVVGKGNNGGDGLALAIALLDVDCCFDIYFVYEDNANILKELLNDYPKLKEHIVKSLDAIGKYDIIVDAIFGIGFNGSIDDKISNLFDTINQAHKFTISIDIPSGLNANNGKATIAIKSSLTFAIAYYKPGHFLNDAKDYIERLNCLDVGIKSLSTGYNLYEANLDKEFSKRKQNSHKGSFGYVAIMGGSKYYSGSVKLANVALSSLIVGSGVSRLIIPECIEKMVGKYVLEATLFPLKSDNNSFVYEKEGLQKAIDKIDALAFGMGISDNYVENSKILTYILNNYAGKLLIDADGLNTLSKMDLNLLNNSKASIVLTPHMKEFSRLINVDVDLIIQNPIYYVKEFSKKYNVVLLLKGTSSIVAYQEQIYIIKEGSVCLSKGGSGDILSGIICGILGYKDFLEATLVGTYLFGRIGTINQKSNGVYGNLPRDTLKTLKNIMKKY